MKRGFILAVAIVGSANAAEYGNADDARAMLNRAVIVLKVDQSQALQEFISGTDTFMDRDLYVFCAGADHRITAHPNTTLIGKPTIDIKDANGKPFVEEMIAVAEPGKIREVSYMYPRLGYSDPLPKVTFTTKINDQVCGVGYYK